VTDWSGRDYAEVSGLQRTMITAASAALAFSPDDWMLDIGCGDNFLTLDIADLVPDAAVSFNALHWVPQQAQALGQIAYEPIAGRPGLFRFTQMRAELRR
jgi:hypothetical protein